MGIGWMNMERKWIVGSDPFTEVEQGYIIHRVAPEFVAKWDYAEDIEALSEIVYEDDDPENPISIYDFQFIDDEPSEEVLLATCREAMHAIDAYIQHRTDEKRFQGWITK